MAEAVSCTPVDLRPKRDSLSAVGPGSKEKELTPASLNAPSAAAHAQRDSFLQNDLDPLVPKAIALVQVVHFDGPDKQFGEVDADPQPGTGLPEQPDEHMQHQVPQHRIEEPDQCISVDRIHYEQVKEPWIVSKPSQAQWATTPSSC